MLAAVLGLLTSCGDEVGFDFFGRPSQPKLMADPKRPYDGVYTGSAVLLEARADCNAGGTAELAITSNVVRYRDRANGSLTGPISPRGVVDIRSGAVNLVGLVEGDTFRGQIVGGSCDYRYSFRRPHPSIPSGSVLR
jgi:hypothetical protein